MEPEERKTEAALSLEKEITPPPLRSKKSKLKLFAVAAVLIALIAVIIYYLRCIAPYESTDDAFIDGYVTLISPRVPGQITRLAVTDNQEVKAGDVLVEIDPRDYAASLSQAQADLAAVNSQSNQTRAQVDVSEAKVVEARAAVTSAEAEVQRADDDLTRYKSVESRAVSKSAIDLAQAQSRTAAANLEDSCESKGIVRRHLRHADCQPDVRIDTPEADCQRQESQSHRHDRFPQWRPGQRQGKEDRRHGRRQPHRQYQGRA